ncbi:MAG TPA: MerR family transcriptional regulator [Candidatus Dormibacteraeota bacterium]
MAKQPAPIGREPGGGGETVHTIDELAQATGMTTRNIRAHQSRGLLPPPVVRGRTGYYSDEHAARLRLILRMQADGFNLGAIRRVLDSVPSGTARQVVDFESALRAAWEEEPVETLTAEELARRFGAADVDLVRRAEQIGLLHDLGDGRFEVRSPTLLRCAEQLVVLGVPLGSCIAAAEDVTRHAHGVARRYVRLYLDEVWRPFEEAGRPEADWPRMQDTLERMRPLALDSLAAAFRLVMGAEVDRAYNQVLRRRAAGREEGASGGAGRRRAEPVSG